MAAGDTWINAAVGAAVTIGFSFTGVSPLLGGGVAGYLQNESPKRGATVGALSGAIATVPLAAFVAIGFWLFAAVPVSGPGLAGGVELLFVLIVVVPLALVWFVGLSAAGGYLGGYVRENR